MVVVNGNDARHQAGLATPLAATDIVSILPIMAGGASKPSAVSLQRSAFGRTMSDKGRATFRTCFQRTLPHGRFGLMADC
jgi:hypothetical protein